MSKSNGEAPLKAGKLDPADQEGFRFFILLEKQTMEADEFVEFIYCVDRKTVTWSKRQTPTQLEFNQLGALAARIGNQRISLSLCTGNEPLSNFILHQNTHRLGCPGNRSVMALKDELKAPPALVDNPRSFIEAINNGCLKAIIDNELEDQLDSIYWDQFFIVGD